MAEPTTPTLAAGLGLAAIASALGLEGGPLFYALVGASIGVTFAPQMARPRWILVFLCVVLACSLLGAFLGTLAFGDVAIAKYARNSFALVLAWGFHPITGLLLTKLPELWDKVLDVVLRKVG